MTSLIALSYDIHQEIYPLLDPASKVALWLTHSIFRREAVPGKLKPQDYCRGTVDFFKQFSGSCNEKDELFKAAALVGNFKLLEHLFGKYKQFCPNGICTHVAVSGSIPCLEYFYGKGFRLFKETCHQAARNGHLECLKWLKSKRCPWDSYTVSGAAEMGHAEVLDYCLQNKCPTSIHAAQDAAKNGHLECLKILKCVPSGPYLPMLAARNGHLHILKYFHEIGHLECDYEPAITNNHIDVLEYYHQLGHPLSVSDYMAAINTKDIRMVRLMEEWECPKDSTVFRRAVEVGNLGIVKFLWEKECPKNEIPRAAGALPTSEILEYLHQQGMVITDELVSGCISFPCLFYLCSLGYKLTHKHASLIIEFGSIESLTLYVSQGGTFTDKHGIMIAQKDQLDAIKLYVEACFCPSGRYAAPLDEMTDIAIEKDSVEALRYYIGHGLMYSMDHYDYAIEYNAQKCRAYLRTLFVPKDL